MTIVMPSNEAPTSESTVGLIGGLVNDVKDLAVAHLEGIRLEVKEELRDLKSSIKYAAAAAAVFVVAALLASFSAAQALWTYTALPSWAAYAITAVLFIAAGLALLRARSRGSQDIDLVPDTGLRRLERDAKWMSSKTREAVS